jgi:DNA-binding XRE family transcriptional regulator
MTTQRQNRTRMREGDIVRLRGATWLGRLVRLPRGPWIGRGRWLVVGADRTAQPDEGLRACELVKSLRGVRCPGARLRAWREAGGLTQAEAAQRAGIPRSQCADLEAGRYDPRLGTLVTVAAVLRRSVTDLLA